MKTMHARWNVDLTEAICGVRKEFMSGDLEDHSRLLWSVGSPASVARYLAGQIGGDSHIGKDCRPCKSCQRLIKRKESQK